MTIHRCPRCGRKTRSEVCRKCWAAEINELGLPPGDWVLRGNTRVWVRDEPDSVPINPPVKRGPKPIPDMFEWTMTDLIEARRQHASGHRTPWAIEGKRVYKREAQRRRRATKTQARKAA